MRSVSASACSSSSPSSSFSLPAVEHHLGVGPDQGQGSLELVGGVGDEGALPLEGLARRTQARPDMRAPEQGGPNDPRAPGGARQEEPVPVSCTPLRERAYCMTPTTSPVRAWAR